MHGPFYFRKGRQTGGGIVSGVYDVKVAHIHESGVIHIVGIDTPQREVYWLLILCARLKEDPPTEARPFVRIITDLNMWWPITWVTAKKQPLKFNAYFEVYEDDNAFVYTQMDCRDKKFIKEEICRKLNL